MRSRPNSSSAPMCSSSGAQYFVGDDANQNPQLPLYWVANLHASYQMDEHVQFFGLINNLFNNRNATYGTFFDTGTDAQLAHQPINFYERSAHGHSLAADFFLWRREGDFLALARQRARASVHANGDAGGYEDSRRGAFPSQAPCARSCGRTA